ncbi:hypothetical protein D3C72_1442290 [compost metagenome]
MIEASDVVIAKLVDIAAVCSAVVCGERPFEFTGSIQLYHKSTQVRRRGHHTTITTIIKIHGTAIAAADV